MATYTGDLYSQPYLAAALEPVVASSALTTRTQYYKLRATSSVDPSGYITWRNTTGDDQGRPSPGGTIGPTIIVARWVQ